MSNKATKQKQLNPQPSNKIIGAGEFTIPISYRWACTNDIVHITTKDRYRGVITAEIPVATLRDIISQVDKAAAHKVVPLNEPIIKETKKKPSIFDVLPDQR